MTDLRRKAIGRWAAGITKSQEIMQQAAKELVEDEQDAIAILMGWRCPGEP